MSIFRAVALAAGFSLGASAACGTTSGSLANVEAGVVIDSDASADDASTTEDGSAELEMCTAQVPPESCPEIAPTYAEVASIIERRCATCHGVPNGPWPLDTYENVADWAPLVRSSIMDCTMPPADAGIAVGVEERQTILAWIRCGNPR